MGGSSGKQQMTVLSPQCKSYLERCLERCKDVFLLKKRPYKSILARVQTTALVPFSLETSIACKHPDHHNEDNGAHTSRPSSLSSGIDGSSAWFGRPTGRWSPAIKFKEVWFLRLHGKAALRETTSTGTYMCRLMSLPEGKTPWMNVKQTNNLVSSIKLFLITENQVRHLLFLLSKGTLVPAASRGFLFI
ncbi:uncharacterized protein LOC125947662 [Dermacentor silvarum]|uniref:uncharacterized protein LOC125947662 n=1 Tax=Dermacentor silvarum TaxID=543639 RepID=UPI002101B188|nr:uncharacterized protein LOC125947662 [Dermacentor silvarum]